MSLDTSWEAVKLFHKTFSVPYAEKPALLTPPRVQKRTAWMLEEIGEFNTAETVAEQADAMIDLIYFALGTMVEMGVKPQKLFDLVQAANMAKLFPDGKPHFNASNKVIKPPDWQSPDAAIAEEIEKQIKE